MPNDEVLSSALAADPELLNPLATRDVAVPSPLTLIVLLRVVAFGWRQERLAASTAEIWRLGRDVHARLQKLTEHLYTVGAVSEAP